MQKAGYGFDLLLDTILLGLIHKFSITIFKQNFSSYQSFTSFYTLLFYILLLIHCIIKIFIVPYLTFYGY